MAKDRYWNYDGAYVLGALPPDERRRYERHIRRCARCAAATRTLAELPDLLAQVDISRLGPEPAGAPRQTAPRRWYRRPRPLMTSLAMVAAALCLITAIVLTVVAAIQPHRPSVAGPVAMTHIVPAPINADVQFQDVAWGTRVQVSCTYFDRDGDRLPASYELVAIDRAGRPQQIATWRVVPGTVAHISATTNLPRADIKSIDVRTPAGRRVLQLNP